MPLSTYPLIAWGSPDDISAYITSGTPIVTTGVADPFGGTGAVTIQDDETVLTAEAKYKTIAYARDGSHVFALFYKAGSAAVSSISVYDSTAGTGVCNIATTWSGGVPSPVVSSGSGTIHGVFAVGGGWYLLLWTANNVVAAHSNYLVLYGATTTASTVGSTTYYVRNAVLLDLIDYAAAFPRVAPGYRSHRNGAGVREAWKPGAEIPMFTGRVRHVPQAPAADPGKSGWYGSNESAGVNCGVLAMLTAAWDNQLLRFIPDRANCAAGVDAYLTSPGEGWTPEFERSWQYAFNLELETSALVVGV